MLSFMKILEPHKSSNSAISEVTKIIENLETIGRELKSNTGNALKALIPKSLRFPHANNMEKYKQDWINLEEALRTRTAIECIKEQISKTGNAGIQEVDYPDPKNQNH